MCGSKFNKPFMVYVFLPCFLQLQLWNALSFLPVHRPCNTHTRKLKKHLFHKRVALDIANELQTQTSLIAYSFLSFTKIAI